MAYTKETKVIEKINKGIRWRYHHYMHLWVSEFGDFYNPYSERLIFPTGVPGNIKANISKGECRRKRAERIVFEAFEVYEDADLKLDYFEKGGKVEHVDGDLRNNSADNLAYKTKEQLRAESRGKATKKKRKPAKRLTYTLLRLNDHLQDSSVEELGQGNEAQDFGEFSNLVGIIIANSFEGRAVLDKDKKSSFILMTKGMV